MTSPSFPRLTKHATIIFGAAMAVAAAAMASGDAATAEAAAEAATQAVQQPVGLYYAIAAIMGIGSLSAAYAVGKVGAAAMGAAAEKPELLGRAIAFVGLAEGIALFGFLISLFLVFK
ncbi:MAG: ATP synthase subunit C [Lentisphaeria bacterium]|jgi:V/A-type H+-transporting ATPase subunit K